MRLNMSDVELAARLIGQAKHLVALTGAGLSVESGIPPFRGPGGIWTKHGEPPMDQYQRLMADPEKAWVEFLNPQGPMAALHRSLDPARPNPGHGALAALERHGLLKAVITQNIDNLHTEAGSHNVLEIHGNYKLLRCLGCGQRFKTEEFNLDRPPRCPGCGGMVKTDMVLFGEPIPRDVLLRCQQETEAADLMLVAGTSATVYPAAAFPEFLLKKGLPVIEVNLYESGLSPFCAVSLRGASGQVLPRLVQAMGLD